MIGFGVGVVAFVIFVTLGVLLCNYVKRRKIVEMEKESERSEALDFLGYYIIVHFYI